MVTWYLQVSQREVVGNFYRSNTLKFTSYQLYLCIYEYLIRLHCPSRSRFFKTIFCRISYMKNSWEIYNYITLYYFKTKDRNLVPAHNDRVMEYLNIY